MAAERPAGPRYEIVFSRTGADRVTWVILAGLAAMVVFGELLLKVVAGIVLVLSLAGLVAHRFHRSFVDLEERGLRVRLGYGPAIRIPYAEVEEVRAVAPSLLVRFAMGADAATEIRRRRRRPLVLLAPFPLVWLSRRLRIPLAEREAFIAAVRERIAVDASAHSF